ncbi:MAG TPA: DUF2007 domain-containing protein [Thermomicrobiales bacterium]|nr:DUF2007 domain-containing protein [Thermomicrobiales bacterium]
MARDEPLVWIAQAGNQSVAEMWQELLKNHGIPCLVRIAGPLTAYATFASPHDMLVLAADAERARQILAAYDDTGDDDRPANPARHDPGAGEQR